MNSENIAENISMTGNLNKAEIKVDSMKIDDLYDAGVDDAESDFKPRSGNRNQVDKSNLGPMEVVVEHSVDKALRVLKRKLIREGILKELKLRRYFEKPCERRKRKDKESYKKRRKEEHRAKKSLGM